MFVGGPGSRKPPRAAPFLVSEVQHTVGVQDFERWLGRGSPSPAEMVLKNRLREMLEKK
jgi:hypothetical protein